jgi:N-acetylmuramidase-like protein/putative peptidoglycan binding protein
VAIQSTALDFQGDGRPLTVNGMDAAARAIGVGLAELWAVVRVETRGWGFLADRRPHTLYERHVFYRLTGARLKKCPPAISCSTPGGYLGGAREYDRLTRALAFDRRAALSSTSWGIGQVMGFHAKSLGFADVEAMVADMVASEDGQLGAMARFVVGQKLDRALRDHHWAGFARGYNGVSFAKNHYDEKLRWEYADLVANGLPDLRLRAAQLRLLYRGFEPGPIDGMMGNLTRTALRRFQAQEGLTVSGEVDDTTEARLSVNTRGQRRPRPRSANRGRPAPRASRSR